jgi:hypothetical protein
MVKPLWDSWWDYNGEGYGGEVLDLGYMKSLPLKGGSNGNKQ